MAAHRAEIREVIIPKDNEKDLEEVPKIVAKNLKFHTVEHLDEVLRHALVLDSPDEFFGAHKTIAGESKVDVPVAEGKDPNPAVQ